MSIEENIARVRERITQACRRCGRAPHEVRLLAVTKNQPAEAIAVAVRAGLRDIAENKVQEALLKKAGVPAEMPGVRWHMIGHLQTNKVKDAVRLFDLIHSVDSLRLAQEIDTQAARAGKVQDILLEVHLTAEESKYGIPPEQLEAVFPDICALPALRVCGLMGMAPVVDDPGKTRPYFRRLRELRDRLGLTELSMGMSDDFETAVEEGATMVRIGRALFKEAR